MYPLLLLHEMKNMSYGMSFLDRWFAECEHHIKGLGKSTVAAGSMFFS